MITLIIKNEKLFALDSCGKLIGKVINDLAGKCEDNPESIEADEFSFIYGGHGYIYHFSENPPNPFFCKVHEVIVNPQLLPKGTEHIFLDGSTNAICDYYDAPLTAEEIYSLSAVDYDGSYWVTVEFKGKSFKCEGVSRCSDETSEEMREAGYIYIENSYQWGREIWISADDIQIINNHIRNKMENYTQTQAIRLMTNSNYGKTALATNFSNRDIYYISDVSMNMFYFTVDHYMPHNMKNNIWVNCVVSLGIAGRL